MACIATLCKWAATGALGLPEMHLPEQWLGFCACGCRR